jgi:transcriptional regulator with XRE-family HTH domain
MLGRWPHLGIPLRAARRELRISQRELAARAATSPATVGRLETGHLDVRCDLVLDVLQTAGLRLLLLGPEGTPLTLHPDDVEVLNQFDTGGLSTLPAHLYPEQSRRLPEWTFSRRMGGPGPLLQRGSFWLFHRDDPEALVAWLSGEPPPGPG